MLVTGGTYNKKDENKNGSNWSDKVWLAIVFNLQAQEAYTFENWQK